MTIPFDAEKYLRPVSEGESTPKVCSYTASDDLTDTSSTYIKCDHGNGWYSNKPGVFVNKKVFVCTSCATILSADKKKRIGF